VCYSAECLRALVDLAEQHQLVVLADEIYDKVVYPPHQHLPMASLVRQVPCLSFNGLSKSHRLAGFRSGWVTATGDLSEAGDLIEGINMLCSMRLCSNVPAQLAVQTALGGVQSIDQLVAEGGRLYQQRLAATEAFRALEGVELVTPQAAMYCFIRVCDELYDLPERDEDLVLAFLEEAHVLIVQGSAFNLQSNRYFRFVFLPSEDELIHAIHLFGEFLQRYRK
jgi:alanine-synthesizing transaminase